MYRTENTLQTISVEDFSETEYHPKRGENVVNRSHFTIQFLIFVTGGTNTRCLKVLVGSQGKG